MRSVVVLLILVLLLAACSVQQSPIRAVQAVLPAAGVSEVDITANVGKVTITPSSDTNVHVSVTLKPSGSFLGFITPRNSATAARGASFGHVLDNGILKLGMQYPADTDGGSAISEDWTVAVPATMQVNTQLNVGKLHVTGISGGVQARMNVGDIVLDVSGGPLQITANVGKIQATVHSLNYATVSLGASVGTTALSVDGVTVGDHQKTGAGDSLTYKMSGKDAISLQVTTGKASLALLTH
ncbi:MAG: hypothetical protein WCC11_11940 [Gammaproteobacteria bacterium]